MNTPTKRRPLFYLPLLLAVPLALAAWTLWRHYGGFLLQALAIAVKVVVVP